MTTEQSLSPCPFCGAIAASTGADEREAFESTLLEIMGGNRVWIERADEFEQGDRLSYCEVWTRRAWLLWQQARAGVTGADEALHIAGAAGVLGWHPCRDVDGATCADQDECASGCVRRREIDAWASAEGKR